LGASKIDAITEDSENARKCNAIYEFVRNDVLTDALWSFAQKRVALTESSTDPVWEDDLMTVAYDKPSDLLKINYTNDEAAVVKVEGSQILSNTSSLKIKYTYEVTDTSTYFSKFIMALAARLAAELAFPITGKTTTATKLMEFYNDVALPEAISADSQQGTPDRPFQDEWILARRHGTSQLVGRTGQEIWYPCCCC
jgi:hypothetical protein